MWFMAGTMAYRTYGRLNSRRVDKVIFGFIQEDDEVPHFGTLDWYLYICGLLKPFLHMDHYLCWEFPLKLWLSHSQTGFKLWCSSLSLYYECKVLIKFTSYALTYNDECRPYLQVMRAFSWCEIVGKRFPICHVHIDDTIVEVCHFFIILIYVLSDSEKFA